MHQRVKIAAIGLGNRTCKYLRYIAERQDITELVAVVDTDSNQFNKILKTFNLSADRCFSSLDDLADSGVQVDACIIGTPDIHHHEMAIKAMRCGWHVLLEKPMGQTLAQCDEIVSVSEQTQRLVSTCYVLRYHPYFVKLKELSERPEMGRILHIKQIERVGKDRLTHTFVRGPWNKTEMNTSVFFTKCCHDVDYALWIAGDDDVMSVESAAGTRMFGCEDAPNDAAERCIECDREKHCPYSAVDLYLRRKDWIKGFSSLDNETEDETITRMLKESRYGRCVYKCPENDVVEHQTIRFATSSGIISEITMECNTVESARITTIECENAVIYGDENTIEVKYKECVTQEKAATETYDYTWAKSMKLHAGADMVIVQEFIDAILNGSLQTRTSCATSLTSHRICFMAEN